MKPSLLILPLALSLASVKAGNSLLVPKCDNFVHIPSATAVRRGPEVNRENIHNIFFKIGYFTQLVTLFMNYCIHKICYVDFINWVRTHLLIQSIPACPTETDVEYIGHNLNEQHYEYDHDEGPRYCASYCENNYPEAIYFSWVSFDWDWTGEDHLDIYECWCKSEGAINDQKEVKGVISGTIECGVDTSSTVGE